MTNYIIVDEEMVQTGSMSIEVSGSIEIQCNQRLTNLYNQSHEWLLKAAYNICKSFEESEELVSDLYVYLAKDCKPHIFWGNSYNLIYCQKFIMHRWYNRAAKLKRYCYTETPVELDVPSDEYNEERDRDMMRAYEDVLAELKRLEITKLWPASKLFQIYWMSDRTLDEVAKEIGISKSTVFLSIKKIRAWLKINVKNPYE